MRISTSMLYDQGVSTTLTQYEKMMKLQNQLATGRRILEPSDDPSASARALSVTQNQAIVSQYTRNANLADSALALHESVLGTIGEVLQDVRALAVNAGNATLSASDRNSIATELKGHYDHLLSLANTKDGSGQYMFSGYQGATQPYTETSPGTVAYNGDQGQRKVQISAARQIAITTPGTDVFQKIRNGNGTFVTAASSSNTGTGLVSPGLLLDGTKWGSASNNQDFTINFHVDTTVTPNVTTYDIVDNVSGDSMLTGAPAGAGPFLRTYTSGSTISLATDATTDTNPTSFDFGAELTISGTPANGDSFTVKESSNQDIFATIHNLITSLGSNATKTGITNNNNTALSNIDLAMDNVLAVRTGIGAIMKEVEGQINTNGDLDLQYKSTLSQLQDLDVVKATSDLTQQKASLDAAQLSFIKIQGLSLFNYMK